MERLGRRQRPGGPDLTNGMQPGNNPPMNLNVPQMSFSGQQLNQQTNHQMPSGISSGNPSMPDFLNANSTSNNITPSTTNNTTSTSTNSNMNTNTNNSNSNTNSATSTNINNNNSTNTNNLNNATFNVNSSLPSDPTNSLPNMLNNTNNLPNTNQKGPANLQKFNLQQETQKRQASKIYSE